MDKYLEIKEIFESREDKENAIAMSKYMRNMFDFYGLPTPKRKEVYNNFIKNEKKLKTIDWDFLDKCYEDSHREFQYLVYDYLLAMKQYVSYDDIPKIKEYIVNKSWWDTIDFLCKVIGDIELRDLRVKDLMLGWSKDDNIWIKRTAIEHQLNLKEKTDYECLSENEKCANKNKCLQCKEGYYLPDNLYNIYFSYNSFTFLLFGFKKPNLLANTRKE